VAVNCVGKSRADERTTPFAETFVLVMKPVPVRTTSIPARLTVIGFGAIDVSVTGGAFTLNTPPDALPPPGGPFSTYTCSGPACCKIPAGIVPSKRVEFTKTVVIDALSRRIWELGVN